MEEKKQSIIEEFVRKLEDIDEATVEKLLTAIAASGATTLKLLAALEPADLKADGAPLAWARLVVQEAKDTLKPPATTVQVVTEFGGQAPTFIPPAATQPFTRKSSLGFNKSSLNKVRLSPADLLAGARGSAAATILGLRFDKLIDEELVSRVKMDIGMRTKLYQWVKKVKQGQYLDEGDITKLFSGFVKIFNTQNWRKVIETSELVTAALGAADLGQFSTTDIARHVLETKNLIPRLQESMSTVLQGSMLPVLGESALNMVNDMHELFGSPEMLQALRINISELGDPSEAPLAAIQEILNRMGSPSADTVLNIYRLALVVEDLITLLGQCPDQVTNEFLSEFGMLVSEYKALFSEVADHGVQVSTPFGSATYEQDPVRLWLRTEVHVSTDGRGNTKVDVSITVDWSQYDFGGYEYNSPRSVFNPLCQALATLPSFISKPSLYTTTVEHDSVRNKVSLTSSDPLTNAITFIERAKNYTGGIEAVFAIAAQLDGQTAQFQQFLALLPKKGGSQSGPAGFRPRSY